MNLTRDRVRSFGWVFVLFSLFWMSGVLSQMSAVDWSRIAFAAFGIPFVVIGFYLAILQYPWNAYVRRNTVYSLTNRRAILSRTGVLGKGLKSYPITPNTNIEYASLAGGSIWFTHR